MFLKEVKKKTKHVRKSKLGTSHEYFRTQTWCIFKCDSCSNEFERTRGSMDPKRLNNNYFHVCKDCDAKRFAQKKGVERKQVWEMNVSSDLPIGRL